MKGQMHSKSTQIIGHAFRGVITENALPHISNILRPTFYLVLMTTTIAASLELCMLLTCNASGAPALHTACFFK